MPRPWNKGLKGAQVAWNKGKKTGKQKPETIAKRIASSTGQKRPSKSLQMKGNKYAAYKHSEEAKKKQSERTLKLKDSPNWKGDSVGYHGLHAFLRKNIGIPDHCDICGIVEQPNEARRNYFEWSCRTGVYNRDLHNWWQLCKKCHVNYDTKFLNVKQ